MVSARKRQDFKVIDTVFPDGSQVGEMNVFYCVAYMIFFAAKF